jgi:hypothetical protein
MTEPLNGVWEHALKMSEYGFEIIPVEGKEAKLPKWPTKGRSTKDGVKRWAKLYPNHNYAIICSGFFVLEIDLDGADFPCELDHIRDILGPFEPGFMVKTGRKGGGYHIYCYSKGREIPKQDLTDLTQIRGVNHYVVGPGSIHPKTGAVYTPVPTFEGRRTDNPAVLTDISDETLNRLAKKRDISQSTERTFALGNGDVLDLTHPPCIRRLMEKGAPKDQEYYQANHTIARYVISSGLSDVDGAAIAVAMAKATKGHKTTKNEFDRLHNFRSCMNSARTYPDANAFACSFVWGSKELCTGGLCEGCPHNSTDEALTDAETAAAVRAEALRIMREEDPFDYIFGEYQKIHVSDPEMGSIFILAKAVQNVLNANGLQPKANGASGKGKTHGKAAVVHLCPQDYIWRGSLSDKALFYHDIKPMSVLFLDDITLSEPLEELARRSMTNFQDKTPHYTLDKTTNKPTVQFLPPRIMWAFTQVDDTLDEQTVNRMVDVTVDESATADELAHKLTAEHAEAASPVYPITFEVLVCREIYRILHEEIGPFYVSVPFASNIAWPHKENRRNFGIFLDLIRGYVALRCMQRKSRDDVVFAVRKDFDAAAALYRKINKTQTTKLNKRQLAVIQAIYDHGKSATLKDLTATLASHGLNYDKIRRILHGRDGRPGLLGRVPGLTYESRQITSSTTTKGDDSSETNTESARVNVYELPLNFRMLEAYDEGAIELPTDTDEIDISALPLGHHLTTALPPVMAKRKVGAAALKEESDAIIDTYTTTLHTTTHILPQIQGTSSRPRSHDGNNLQTREKVPAFYASGKVGQVLLSAAEEDQKKHQKENGDVEGKNVVAKQNGKTSGKVTSDGHVPARAFVAKLGAFKILDMQKRHPQTPETLRDYLCREVADERSKHLDDVRADWDANCNDPDIVRYLGEIFGVQT